MPELFLTADGKKVFEYKASGPTSYTSPYYTRIPELLRIDSVLSSQITGGYEIEADVATGNVVISRVYYQTGVSGVPKAEVASGINLSGEKIKLIVLGT